MLDKTSLSKPSSFTEYFRKLPEKHGKYMFCAAGWWFWHFSSQPQRMNFIEKLFQLGEQFDQDDQAKKM